MSSFNGSPKTRGLPHGTSFSAMVQTDPAAIEAFWAKFPNKVKVDKLVRRSAFMTASL